MIRVYVTEKDYIEVEATEAKIIDGALQLYNRIRSDFYSAGIFAPGRWVGAVKVVDK